MNNTKDNFIPWTTYFWVTFQNNTLHITNNTKEALLKKKNNKPDTDLEEIFKQIKQLATDNPKNTYCIEKNDHIKEHIIKEKLTNNYPENILLPGQWLYEIDIIQPRVIVAGGREFNDYELLYLTVKKITGSFNQGFTIISGHAKGADHLGEVWAKTNNIPFKMAPADWDNHKKIAGPIRNEFMGWYSTHLVTFWDGKSSGTKNMISIAKRENMPQRTIQYEQQTIANKHLTNK